MGTLLRDSEECARWGSWKGGELWVPRALEEAVATGGPAHRREREGLPPDLPAPVCLR